MDPAADREKQQEQLRQALLAAADEEGAAIIDQARRDITLAVRRARRDLHLIRAQLHLCGVEVAPLSLTPPVEPDAGSLDEGVPQDAIVVGRTHPLRHVVTEASLELAQLSATVVAPPPPDEVVIDRSAPEGSTSPATRSRRSLFAVGGLVLLVIGATGWMYSRQRAQTAPLTRAGSPGDVRSLAPTTAVVAPQNSPAQEAASPGVLPSRIVLQTVRMVWMRIEVDGAHDVGRVFPEGKVVEFTPTRDLLIRAGDAGAVLIGVGGAPLTALGQSGQVITRRIAINQPTTTSVAAIATSPPPAIAPTAVAPDGRSDTSARASDVAAVSADPHAEILAKHQRWFEAFVRGDRQSLRPLTAESFSLRDERTAAETNSRSAAPEVSDIQVDVAGVGAVLTGRLRTVVDGVPRESQLSEVWIRNRQQEWALMGVRITPAAP